MLSMQFTSGSGGYQDIWAQYKKHGNITGLNMLELWDRKDLLSENDRESLKYLLKDIIDDKIIQTVASKVRQCEHHIKNTKKGFANMMKSMFKSKERSDNEGLKKDFVMNQQELSMKSLTDLSFLFQDYKTYGSFVKYPMNDFKSIKAYRHSSS